MKGLILGFKNLIWTEKGIIALAIYLAVHLAFFDSPEFIKKTAIVVLAFSLAIHIIFLSAFRKIADDAIELLRKKQ